MPAESKIFGSCNIWRPKDAQGESFTSDYLTSSIYPVYELELLDVSPDVTRFRVLWGNREFFDLTPSIDSVNLRDIVQIYVHPEIYSVDINLPSITQVELLTVVQEYTHPEPYSVDINLPSVTDVTLSTIVVEYTHPEPYSIDMNLPSVTSISLVTV